VNLNRVRKLFTFSFWKNRLPKFRSNKGKFECNLCGNKADAFYSDNWHENTICPYCGSDVRHRLEMAIFQYVDEYKNNFIKGKILHFAAEKQIVNKLKKHSEIYICADITTGTDIMSMPQYSDETFDIVIANDVLEHIAILSKGIKEVNRVLKKGGYFICTVPQRDNLEKTEEDPNINTPQLREKHYGQSDHLRIFGNDFKSILENYNFHVKVFDKNSFQQDIVEKHILFPQKLSREYNVTNYRKIYVCKKN